MTGDAVGLITNVLREHVSAGAKIDYLTGVVSVKCKACKEWIPDSGEYAGGFKEHVAAEVDAALGGLTRERLVLNEYAAANGVPLLYQWRWSSGWTVGAPEEAEK